MSLLKKRHSHQIDIHFKDLIYEVSEPKRKEKKKVLKGITGTFRSGEITAIMGPSGAGKSSLMNILTGFTKQGVKGTINFGDAPKARKLCCYIMQDDHFYSWYTVEETMMLAASLKIANDSMSLKEKKALVEHLLETLKLSHTKNTRCSRLSGGQKKRLSIALELIDNPAVLFLDEPTTGLDSSSSYDVIELLVSLANEGRTIVCTIHQPSSNIYNLFNQIYVMSRGYCTYRGIPQNTVEFLNECGLPCPMYHNPADFLLECVNGDYGDHTVTLAEEAKNHQWLYNRDEDLNIGNPEEVQIVKMLEIANEKKKLRAKPSLTPPIDITKHIYPPAEWMRLWLLIGRCHVQIFRDWTVTYLKLALHILCAILIGLLFGDSGSNASKQISNSSSALVHLLYLWYTTIMPAVLRFPDEISIVKKETFNNWYKLKTYYLAAIITSTPVHIVFSSVYTSIVYFLTDQPVEIERYLQFIFTTITCTVCAEGFGLIVGTSLNPINGTFIGAISTCFMLLFSGFLIFITHMSKVMQTISFLSPLRYFFEMSILSLYGNNRADTICPEDQMYCHFQNSKYILKTFGFQNSDFTTNALIVVAQIVIVRTIAFFTLRHKVNS